MKARTWKAYLPIKLPYRGRVTAEDVAFFAQRGIVGEQLGGALTTLRHVRKDLVPAVARLDPLHEWHFFVHDFRGVTCLDLSVFAKDPFDLRIRLPSRWTTLVAPATKEIAGIDRALLVNKDLAGILFSIADQSEWYLDLISLRYKKSTSDVELLKQIGQHLHFLANMTQMQVA